MKYNWWLITAIIIIWSGLSYILPAPQEVYGEDVVFEQQWVDCMGDAVSAWKADQILNTAQENQEQDQDVNRYLITIISEMTLEQKLAQLMILTNGNDMTPQALKAGQPGGIILFSKDFTGKTTEQVKKQMEEYQAEMIYPLFVGVDEEGGEVSRIAELQGGEVPVFQSARQLYETGGLQLVYEDTISKTRFLASMGINLNFAPVADVVENESSYMYERSASSVPEQAADYVETVVDAMAQEHMRCCLKHFPGYGENANTHQAYVVDQKSLSSYRSRDFIPFYRGIAAGADMVMVSHIVMEAVDGTQPASLSPKVHTLLREELGFDGVVVADDLNMQAVLSRMSLEDATAEALSAGNDMIFSADFEASMRGIKKAVDDGRISMQQIDDSVTRVLRMKINQGLVVVPKKEQHAGG